MAKTKKAASKSAKKAPAKAKKATKNKKSSPVKAKKTKKPATKKVVSKARRPYSMADYP